ncbi:MAG: efflux RND transporter periplasmic adaptor subunit [Ardenticatenales bacterium]|nr:efflux RND transporter periplasmic adaptor subunit [Ardenticatenales bacterium]
MKKRWFLALLAVVGATLFLWWFFGSAQAPAPASAFVVSNEVRVTRGDLAARVEATGRVEAEQHARLSLPVGALVASVTAEVGDEVEAGATLLTLDSSEFELRRQEAAAALAAAEAQEAKAASGGTPAEIEAAQASLRAAQLALSVAEVKLDEVPEEERDSSEELVRVEQARASVEQARAALRLLVDGAAPQELAVLAAQSEQARVRLTLADVALASAVLRAPFTGMITERLINVGERVNPSQPLMALAALNTLIVAAEVDEVDVGRVLPGQLVTVTLDAFPTRPLPGEVWSIAPASGEQRGATTYRTVIRFDPADLPVRLGMAADLRIRTADARNALLLPLSTIRYAETQPYVLVRRGEQSMEQDVRLGAQDERMVEILEGIEEGEIVLAP